MCCGSCDLHTPVCSVLAKLSVSSRSRIERRVCVVHGQRPFKTNTLASSIHEVKVEESCHGRGENEETGYEEGGEKGSRMVSETRSLLKKHLVSDNDHLLRSYVSV